MLKQKILSPVGYFDSLKAAIKAKTDSIYFGIKSLNMRSKSSKNFSIDDLEEIRSLTQENNIKAYLTVNSIIYDEDIKLMKEILLAAKKNNLDAIIAHDFATLEYAKEIGIKVHLSTQANISNVEAVRFYSRYADVVVLARELNLNQIKHIVDTIKKEKITGPSNELIKIEIFIHGALCVAVSGKCYMSLAQYNKSANRGECLQACRRKYIVIEEETGKELVIDNKYVMSPKDICTIFHLEEIVKAGVSLLKIEGRGRSSEYVLATTKCYREALELIETDTYTQDKKEFLLSELSKVYNRGFWHGGYYLGKDSEMWTKSYGSKAKEKKIYIGKATNFFSNINVAEFLLHSHSLKIGDEVLIIGPTTGIIKTIVLSMQKDKPIKKAFKGDLIAIKLDEKIRRNDKLYLLEKVDGS